MKTNAGGPGRGVVARLYAAVTVLMFVLAGCSTELDLDCKGCETWTFKYKSPMYLQSYPADDTQLTTDTLTALFGNAVPAAIQAGHDVIYLNVYKASGQFVAQVALVDARLNVEWYPNATEFH